MERVHLMGCAIDNLTMGETIERVAGFIATGAPHQHVVVNVDKIVKAAKDPSLRKIINECALVNVDGMPVVWASRLLGKPLKERVAGVDLFEELMREGAARGWRIYLLGATHEVVTRVREVYVERYPSIKIVGWRDGYWHEGEDRTVAEAIGDVSPDLLFVAISSPKKEQFLGRYQEVMKVPFAMGVGGTFDVVTGKVRRAPRWMQMSGLEWFFRFLQEPRRMFKRYFVDDLYFLVLVARELRRRW
jgi:N-acetylglucosaminyldiphosphoundecaprenol N-acetyl-beta-D-mannosaminyltransferase